MKLYRLIKMTPEITACGKIFDAAIDADALFPILERNFPGCYSQEEVVFRHSKGHDLTGKRILVMRRGGYGDLLWITRIIRKLHEIYSNLTVDVACNPRHHMVFHGNPDVNRLFSYPIPLKAFNAADYHLTFEKCIEPDRTGRNVYELYAERAGVKLTRDEMVPIYSIPVGLRQAAKKIIKGFGIKLTDKLVMIHMGASTPWKSYPPQHSISIAAGLGKLGVKVILIGNKNVFPFEMPDIKNVYQTCYIRRNGRRVDYCDIDMSVAMMSYADLLIGQDSGLTHFAAALKVPCLAIYGAFPAKAYVSTYSNVEYIEPIPGVCPKQPCFPHLNNVCSEIDNSNGQAKCLLSIRPDTVYFKALEMIGIHVTRSETPKIEVRKR